VELVEHLASAGSMYAILAEHRGCVPGREFHGTVPSEMAARWWPAWFIGSVLVSQPVKDQPDAEATTELRCDLRWKVACGLPIDHTGVPSADV
jgi:hypothetical protein